MKISKYIIGFFNIFFIILFLVIFKNSFEFNIENILKITAFSIILCGIFFCIKKIPEKHYTTLVICIFVGIIALQFFYIFLYASIPGFDLGKIYEAVEDSIIKDIKLEKYEYFNIFPNNAFLGLILKIIFEIMNFFGNDNYFIGGILFNVIIVNISILLMYKIVSKILNKSCAVFSLFMVLVTIPLHIYTVFFYTDTLSMIFPLIILYLYIKYVNIEQNKKSRYILMSIIGIVAGIGFYMKSTVLLIVIAIVLYELFCKHLKNVKYISVLIILLILMLFVFNKLLYIFNVINERQIERKSFPYSYWVLVGLNYQGSMDNMDDLKSVKAIEGKEAKKQYIKDRIEYKINYAIEKNILFDKIRYNIKKTWGDSTYFVYVKTAGETVNNDVRKNVYVNSGIKDKIDNFMDIRHFTMLILMIISAFAINKKEDSLLIIKITIIGLALFLMIFECRSRYLVNYIPFFLILETYSVNLIYFNILKIRDKCLKK